MSLVFFVLLTSGALATEDATKNHRLERRQDDSFLFFGGWRPVKSSNGFHHGSATGRYHDLISALPGNLDTSSSYYTHSLPTNYYKDIYSYYPRPAIKAKPKKNTPVYMERYMPQRQQPKQGGRRGVSGGHPQFIDIQKLDLKQIQGLQDILIQAKELPLSQLNLHNNKGGKGFDLLEVSVQTHPQGGHNTGLRNGNKYSRNRWPQRNNKGSYGGRIPQHISPAKLPLQYQYITVPKIKSFESQEIPKEISVLPVNLQHSVSGIGDILNLKNIQVVEVPVPASSPILAGKSNRGSQYGGRISAYSQPQYRIPSPKTPKKVSFPANTFYAHQTEQPRKHYAPPQPAKSGYNQQQQQHQPQIEAELVKLSEDEIQSILKNIHVVNKNSQDLMKIIPLAEAAHKSKPDQVHLILALPQGNHGVQNVEISTYGARNHGVGEPNRGYGNKEQYVAVPQQASYLSHGKTSISQNSGGYQIESQNQAAEHNAAGYQIDEQSGNPYEQQYQIIEEPAGYGQNAAYQEGGQNTEYATADGQQEYGQVDYNAPSQQPEVHSQQEQYIEVIQPPSENGYRREPVLAVEIHKGQSIVDAIKAIDPETLQRLGAHGKDGLEIEVVEVPLEEYSAESKKTETYVASSNNTTKAPVKKSTSTSITVSTKNTTTAVKKS